MAPKRQTIAVTERAVTQRINRVLEPRGEMLKRARGRSSAPAFVIDVKRGSVVRADVDVAALARELGVLEAWEHVE